MSGTVPNERVVCLSRALAALREGAKLVPLLFAYVATFHCKVLFLALREKFMEYC